MSIFFFFPVYLYTTVRRFSQKPNVDEKISNVRAQHPIITNFLSFLAGAYAINLIFSLAPSGHHCEGEFLLFHGLIRR